MELVNPSVPGTANRLFFRSRCSTRLTELGVSFGLSCLARPGVELIKQEKVEILF